MAAEDGALIGDDESGLFTEDFMRALLPTRIATARRSLKQLGLIHVAVVAQAGHDLEPSLGAVGAVGEIVLATLRDSDIAARLDDGGFAMLLEFTPVDGCVVVAERFNEKVAATLPDVEVWAGVACYPAHAIDAPELISAAARALADARAAAPGTVVVAPVGT